jgi:hypothetical protein
MTAQILEALFSGAKAFVREAVQVAREAVRVILEEVDRSSFGRAAAGLVTAVTERYFKKAQNLAEEEAELAEKFRRDGKRTTADAERLSELEAERSKLRRDLDAARTKQATKELREQQGKLIAAPVTDDDASASSGIMAAKECPSCGDTMRIRQGGYNARSERRSFWWQCTNAESQCPTIRFDPEAERGTVLRKPDADLDGSREQRRKIWERPDVLAKTHGRIRAALGDADNEIVCPHHAIPMKLIPKSTAGGRLLDSYEYVCLGVTPEGLACEYKLPLETFSQVSATLRRRDGRGIIDG